MTTPDEVCLSCGKENSPRTDDVPFCSSCAEAGWPIAYTRGAQAFVSDVLSLAHKKSHAQGAPTYEVHVAEAFAELRLKYGDVEALRMTVAAQKAYRAEPPTAEWRERLVAAAKKLTPQEVMGISVRAGIHNPDGTLTEKYGGPTPDGDERFRAIEEVLRISDRDHDAWQAARVALNSIRSELTGTRAATAAQKLFTELVTPDERTPCCWTCTPDYRGMMLCATCGNKRCPRANNHTNRCTNSNEPGQWGSAYEKQGASPEHHKARHVALHKALDELVADWILHTDHLPSKSTVMELMEWANEQRENPTEIEP